MRSVLPVLLLVAASVFALAAPQVPQGSLSKAEVLDMVKSSVPKRVIAAAVRQYGIAFEASEEVLKEFRKAGANDAVIAALRDSRRLEPTSPMSESDILMLLAEGVRSERIIYMVQRRGIGFQPADEYFERLRSSGAKDELIDAIRTAATEPLSEDNILQLITGGKDTGRICEDVEERGINFDATEDDLSRLRAAGAPESILQAIREAKRVTLPVHQLPNAPGSVSAGQTGRYPFQALEQARVICPPSVSSIPVFASSDDLHATVAQLRCGDEITILEMDSGKIGIDKVLVAGVTEGFVQDVNLRGSGNLANSNIRPPVPTFHPEPPYSSEARHDRIEGTVVLMVVVDSQGNIIDARETSKRVGGGLDEQAVETVKTWKFKPATLEGVPIPVRVIVEVAFRLYHPGHGDS